MKKDITTRFDNRRRDPLPPDDAPACIVLIYGGDLGTRTELRADAEVTVGRDEDNTIAIDLSTLSRHHARFFQRDGWYWVEDLESTNGTFVEEEEVTEATQLRNGDIVRLGGVVFKFIEGGNIEALYHEEIHRMTIIDGLTQVANKRHLLEFLDREITRAKRHGRPLSIALLDIDHFKKINDSRGHLAGDRVLQLVAEVAQSEVRRDELLARFGGEEFAIVLPETDEAGASHLAERIRQKIEDYAFDHDGQPIPVTASLGVAELTPDDTLESLVEKADKHLYTAKGDGRNRVVGGT